MTRNTIGKKTSELIKYTIYGALFGCAFPIMGTVIQCYVLFGDVSYAHLIEAQRTSP
jgi:hypothetical protein